MNKTSFINFYGDRVSGPTFPLQYSKNFAIDDIEAFLSRYALNIGSPVFQYIKHALDLTLKIDLGENYQAPSEAIDFIKYLSITNQDEAPVYYFVMKAEILSERSIRLTLKADAINSMLTASSPRKLTFNARTKVTREHQSRFYKIASNILQRRIPLLSEGITPLLYKKNNYIINDLESGSYASKNWYLIYKTEYTEETKPAGIPNPVKAYLLHDDPIIVQVPTPQTQYILNKDILISRYQGYKTLAFTPHEGNNGTITIGSTSFSLNDYDALIFLRNANNVNLWTLYALRGGNTINSVQLSIQNAVFTGSWNYGAFMNNDLQSSSNNFIINNSYELHYNIEQSDNKLNINILLNNQTIAFKDLDRTDPRLVKIVCLPYCPINYRVVEGAFTSAIDFTLKDALIALPLNCEFDVDFSKITSKAPLKNAIVTISPAERMRRTLKDSKLYHSDYYIKKYVYDSFNYTLKLEQILNEQQENILTASAKIEFKYNVSNGIKSAFMFSVIPSDVTITSLEDYDGLIYVNRNNEIATFDSAYINYLRTGFNYDVKNKNRQEATNWIGTIGGIAGTIAGVASGNAILTAGSVITTITSLTSAISSTIQSESNLQSKIAQLQDQRASVINADDVNLLIKYSSNKLALQEWSASDQVLALLDDLFYYTGYLTNEYKAPTHNSRLYFDFLMCEPVFNSVFNWSDELINEVTNKLQEGVTFFHKVGTTFNTAQDLENWETDLL